MGSSLSLLKTREQTPEIAMAGRYPGPTVRPCSVDCGRGVRKDRIPVAALLSLAKDAERPVDGVDLRVEELVRAWVEASTGASPHAAPRSPLLRRGNFGFKGFYVITRPPFLGLDCCLRRRLDFPFH